jgi:1-acyl-sn-glycerol-3-phosphate acyltransferase
MVCGQSLALALLSTSGRGTLVVLQNGPEMSRDREPAVNLLWYHLFKWSVVSPMLGLYFRGRVYGTEHVPKTGPLIVVANHASDFDPPLLSAAVRRPVSYMAKEELFKVPVLNQAIRLMAPTRSNGAAPIAAPFVKPSNSLSRAGQWAFFSRALAPLTAAFQSLKLGRR